MRSGKTIFHILAALAISLTAVLAAGHAMGQPGDLCIGVFKLGGDVMGGRLPFDGRVDRKDQFAHVPA